jgi:hypothetical protein
MAWATAHAFEPKDPMSRSTAQPEHPPKVTDLLIRQKCESMIKYGYVALRQFPKFERHVLAAELRTSMWALLRLIVVCNKRHHKKTTLQDLDAELDLLRCQVRLAKALGYLDFQKYEHWAKLNDETSQDRMVRAIVALQATGTPSVVWVLADNSTVQATAAELAEALALAGAAQAALWVAP